MHCSAGGQIGDYSPEMGILGPLEQWLLLFVIIVMHMRITT